MPNPNLSGQYLTLIQKGKFIMPTQEEVNRDPRVLLRPLVTDKMVHERLAIEIEKTIGAAPLYYDVYDERGNILEDTINDVEIYSVIDLQSARHGFFGDLTHEEVGGYIRNLRRSSSFMDLKLRGAFYKNIPRKIIKSIEETPIYLKITSL